MDLFTAERNARMLMAAHGLTGWTFQWDRAARRFGQCRYSTRTISMSAPLTKNRDANAVRNTMLHEIAHALVGPGHGHDHVWRAKAMSIGCDGQRCGEAIKPEYKYIAKCPNGHLGGKFLRKSKSITQKSCSKCYPVFNAAYRFKLYAI